MPFTPAATADYELSFADVIRLLIYATLLMFTPLLIAPLTIALAAADDIRHY
jgi:hypothetical protein